MRKKLFLFFVFLLATVSGAMAQYTVTLTSEHTSGSVIYAGTQNYFALKVQNTSGGTRENVTASFYIGEEKIGDDIAIGTLPDSEEATKDFVDNTIRPVDEYTVLGNSNQTVTYKVVITDGSSANVETSFPFTLLYNGNLGKEYAYTTKNTTLKEFSFTGDVEVLNGDGEYLSGSAISGSDKFTVDLKGGSVYKAFLYVSYYWDKNAAGDFNSWTTTFNGSSITPLANYRDQTNLGSYGSYGYGLVVYDVTANVVDGSNTFDLTKTNGNAAVYKRSLILMTSNPTGSPKAVYILEEADLLSKVGNQHVEPSYESSFQNIAIGEAAELYVFAATAQAGEGNLQINNDVAINDVWTGDPYSLEVYQTSVASGDLSVKFISTGSTILALHQMLVVDLIKANEGATGEYWATYYNGTKSCVADANTTVYTAALNGDMISLTEVTNKTIPAGNAVILKSTSASIAMSSSTATGTLSDNILQGTDTDITNPGNAYCLSKSGTAVGFYKFTAGGTIPAHRAYFVKPASSRSFYSFGDDGTTGVDGPVNLESREHSTLFDLMGRKVSDKPRSGVYVRNGKKVIIK